MEVRGRWTQRRYRLKRDYAHQELQRTVSIENKHTLDCFKNCGLLQLSTQTFPKNIIVNHLINGKNRRKKKGLRTKVKKIQSAICNSVIGQNCSRGPCPTPWEMNMGAIHSTKIPTGPTGKSGPPQKVDPFFRNFPVGPNRSIEFRTEISGNFGWMDHAHMWLGISRHLFPYH